MGRHGGFSAAIGLVFVVLASSCGLTPGDSEPLVGSDGLDECPEVDRVAPAELPLGEVIEGGSPLADHVLCPVGYDTSPPVGGAHFPAWQNCGFYARPLLDEVAVHSLEHGAVWITYAEGIDTAELDLIEAAVAADTHLLASPYPGLTAPIVLNGWLRQLAVASWSDPAVDDFLSRQLGRLSETAPEAGASCQGAIGAAPDDPLARYDEALAQFSS